MGKDKARQAATTTKDAGKFLRAELRKAIVGAAKQFNIPPRAAAELGAAVLLSFIASDTIGKALK